jgi:hypothetical protein
VRFRPVMTVAVAGITKIDSAKAWKDYCEHV